MKNLKQHHSYILQRLLPMAVFFFIFQIFTRISLIIWEFGNIEISFFEVFKLFFVGLWFDFIALSFFCIPYILYLVFLPKKFHLGRFDHLFTRFSYIILLYILCYNVVAEWIFWDEFHVRFNFIAVDYLVYTNEVLENIWQSYPIVWLLIAIAAVTGLIFYYTKNLLLFAHSRKVGAFGSRLVHGLIYGVVVISLFFASNLRQSEITLNSYVNEIAKNGIFSLFSAFRNNELDYSKFYLTSYQDNDLPSMQSLVKNDDDSIQFVSDQKDDITRFIAAKGEEHRKNVIIVMMESLSAEFMGKFTKLKTLTPNLDQLAKESLFFTKFYATGTRTVRGMEALTLSVPPTPGRSIVKRPNNENLASLGFVFKERGYDTKFLYSGNGYFDNMNYFYENNGFEIVDKKYFAEDERTFANAWGLCDEDLYSKTISEANKSFEKDKNFMFMVMTTSNHRPYTFPPNDANIPTSGGRRPEGVRYADYAIGKFMEKAKKQPWFDNTIFIFVSDHTAGSAGKVELAKEKYHIPMIIYSPSFIEPSEFSKYASQIDMAPTLLGLLNFSYYSRFYGQNVLSENYVDPRTFVANYQKIGYVSDDVLTILKPGQNFSQYSTIDDELLKETNVKFLLDTIKYYGHASNWRQTIDRVDTVNGVTKNNQE